jgi:hypothetical protein
VCVCVCARACVRFLRELDRQKPAAYPVKLQDTKVSAEKPERECPIMRKRGGILRRLPAFLGEHTPESKLGTPGQRLRMTLTSPRKNDIREANARLRGM